MTTAWIVDDDASIRWVLERAFANQRITARSFATTDDLLDALETQQPDVLFTDIRMPGLSGLELIERVRATLPDLPIIIMTAYSDLDSAVSAYQRGAFEYLPKPFDVDDAVDLARRAAHSRPGEVRAPKSNVEPQAIIGQAPAMQALFRAIGRLSESSITALITGESGTGKELVARALHDHSPRAKAPFVAVNTAAIPKDLMESEFFGHEKGAFTGADSRRPGRFEQADGGTLFLDEIGEMPLGLQTRLLRVLQEGSFYRVGGRTPVATDVRVLAATNRDLENEIATGNFREDLFYRLNVIHLHVPPLRERRDDIPALLDHCLRRAAEELGTAPKTLTPEVHAYLLSLDWPGNVRQLENDCRRLTVMAPGDEIVMEDLPGQVRDVHTPVAGADIVQPRMSIPITEADNWDVQLADWAERRLEGHAEQLLDDALPRFERAMIIATLKHTGGRRQEAARLLGWGRNTLTRKIKVLNIADSDHA